MRCFRFLDKLIGEYISGYKYKTIQIVGVPGSGKTTLLNMIFNNRFTNVPIDDLEFWSKDSCLTFIENNTFDKCIVCDYVVFLTEDTNNFVLPDNLNVPHIICVSKSDSQDVTQYMYANHTINISSKNRIGIDLLMTLLKL